MVGGCYEVRLAGKKVELRNQIANAPLEGMLERPTDQGLRSSRDHNRQAMITRVVVIFTVASFAWAAAAQPKFQKLTGAQIRAKFGGMELSDEVHWYELFEKNGTLLSSSMGRKRTGKWWTEKDQLCIGDSESTNCYDVRVSGNKVQLRAEGLYPEDAVLRSPISRR
jgi:hypothetical protein